jgi:endonuclease YncB( thermonuclease family)
MNKVCAIAVFVLTVAPALPLSAQRLFIVGLDGALYVPYRPATIQNVQKSLQERGLYDGPMNGVLDGPTMKAIYAFQEANNLQLCGVPTPNTRKMLEQGSHTDLSFRSRIRRERIGPYRAVRSRM